MTGLRAQGVLHASILFRQGLAPTPSAIVRSTASWHYLKSTVIFWIVV
jgi:hypothetical protein